MLQFLLMIVLAVAGPGSAPAPAAPAAASTPVFPTSPAGRHAEAWFTAFNQGEAAMRSYLETHVSAAGLEKRPLADRLAIYRDLHSDFGRLVPLEVAGAEGDGLRVVARAASGMRVTLTFLCEPDAPHALAGIRIEAQPDDGGDMVASAAGPPMSDEQVAGALHARLDSLARADAFSGAVLLARGDRVLLREAFGLASRRGSIANRPETRFNLGSINKIFTRIAIEQLAAAGRLAPSDTIARYLPDYPADKGRRITIAQLLDHRAGTGDIFNRRYNAMDVSRLRTVADWMDLIRDQPLEFEPGARQEYSNAGYVLLGAIVEKVSGLSYYDYVQRRILEPAGMRATGSYARDQAVPDRAIGYTRRSGAGAGWRENTDGLPGRGSPAGGGYSTVDDLRRFADALRAGWLGVPPEPGLGIAGGSPGVNAVLEMQGDYTGVVLANLDPPVAEQVAAALRGWLRRAGAPGGPEHRILRAGGAHGAADTAADTVPGEPNAHVRTMRRVMTGPEGADPERLHGPKQTVLPAGIVDVPMGRSGHLPLVEVMLNGQGPFRFALDTGGAGAARVDSALAARLGMERIGDVQAGDPSGRNMRLMPIVAVDSIRIGDALFTGLAAAVRDYNESRLGEHVDGILGFGLFADCLLTLDYPASRLRIARGELPPADGARVLAFSDERGIPQVALDVAGHVVPADVDAGSMGGFSLPESLATQLPLASAPTVVGRARTVTNTFEIKGAQLKGAIALGDQRFTDPMVTFQPLFPMANVGARILRDFRVTFDQKHHRMSLERPAAPPDSAAR